MTRIAFASLEGYVVRSFYHALVSVGSDRSSKALRFQSRERLCKRST